MDRLNKDLVELMKVLELDDILYLCRVDKSFDKLVCKSQEAWKEKLREDFPNSYNKYKRDPGAKDYKRFYLDLYDSRQSR